MSHALPDCLPEALRQRCRLLNDRDLAAGGDYVLLWAHHALRDHDNPALDAALHLGVALDRPVLVYQGLGGGHRFDADRHHAFILQGAHDYQRALAARGIRHHTNVPGLTPGAGLADLLPRAAALVCEDFPAPPFPRWTRRWAERCDVLCLAVDAACIVPMAATGTRFDRAFAYREAMQARFQAELDAGPAPPPAARPWKPGTDGPTGGLDWDGFDLATALAHCAIDHTVPPVADTPGGSASGYARWAEFRGEGLRRYHQLRNDAAVEPPLGVSRMSPYLHYGMVSPWRLAREAREQGGPGAKKFIDELWVWRELAWQWCWHTPDVEAESALPGWARETLAEHAADPRPDYTDESLHRGRSGERLWDLAQRSLLRHGELHNNLRMTWGKALVGWSHDAGEAMRRLRDLNHRFALDGNDPASYGGLWWCLGLFDRPFTPAQPVLGTLRGRSIRGHERRLDVARYAARVGRASRSLPRVAVLGAGLAGAAAAQALVDQGYAVQVVDKSRGSGGRLSTRRSEVGPFDHGAQFLRAHDLRFQAQVARWLQAGLLQSWTPRAVNGEALKGALVAVPGMSELVKPLLDGADLQLGRAVTRLQREGGIWRLLDAEGATLAEAEQLIVTAPAPQAEALLGGAAPSLAGRLREARYAPCWASMVEIEGEAEVDLLRERGPIAWATADASRPGRPDGGRWLIHATPAWSRKRLESPAEDVGEALASALSEALQRPARLVAAHRWRYALVEQPLGVDFLAERELGLRVAGDHCLGGRLEAAWLSGCAAAGDLMREVALPTQVEGTG
ncbi:FAD-dependent oxidoreductase [Pseudomarimonas salicorniae]|uniref:FAD-dependent oxidoreductase n=1 Tax=Pseudomarimonas salicorniae TaxID=2933270 RepID=A0ABT0GHI6_9GAMM|nr:FAD-dependent oxidoreductase [Lysobacter sp. CAU 1642]MCK7594009.1 FAD-dependent oxidoreductase [Lysobacter sp. CAU 1642]